MNLEGTIPIAAPRAAVWAALNDTEVLRACIPGCEELTRLSDTELSARVKQKIGPVSATFSGKVTLSDIVEREGYTISGEGTGGVAGFAKGGAAVKLADGESGGTVLTYRANAQVGGKLAQLGARLIDATAKMLSDQFFRRFAETVEAQAGAGASGGAATGEPAASVIAVAGGGAQAATARGGFPTWAMLLLPLAAALIAWLALR
jgi:carbon monoxide dehydrogenase subunit G